MVSLKEIGPWAYIVGVVIALIAGFFAKGTSAETTIALIIGLLGVIVGLLNVTDKEVQLFLVASVALVVAGGFLSQLFLQMDLGMVTEGLAGALSYLVTFTAPAAAVIAIIALYKLSRD